MAYGAYGPEQGKSVQVADDGNFVVAGSTGSFGSGTSDIYMLKLDGNGAVLWSRTIGSPMIEEANDLLRTSDGGWLIVGTTNGSGSAGGYDGLLIRTDPDGNEVWRKEYGGSSWDFFRKGLLQDDGGFLLVGQTFSQGTGGDAWLVKTDQYGDTMWTRHFGDLGLDDGQGVAMTYDGSIVIAGSSTHTNGDVDAYVVKLDGQLDVSWANTYGGDSLDAARDIVVTQDGGFSIVGVTRSFSEFVEHDHFKLSSGGDLLWQKHWGQINDQEAYRHIELPSGGFATTGWTTTSGGGGKDMFLFLCDPQGEFMAQRTFGGAANDMGYALVKTLDGFIVCGSTLSYGAGNEDVFVVRTDSAGNTASETVTTYFDPLPVEETQGMDRPLLYPNPTSGPLHLPEGRGYTGFELMDVSGRTLRAWGPTVREVDLSGFSNGILLLKALNKRGDSTIFRVILNRH